MEQAVTYAGNLTRDPELNFLPNGTPVCNFTLAFTPSYFDDRDREWVDRETVFVDCTAWRTLAENVTESCRTGQRLMVTGYWRQQNWEDRDSGKNRSKICIEVTDVGASMLYGETRWRKNGDHNYDDRDHGSRRGG